MKLGRNSQILLGLGAGVGLGYLYFKSKKKRVQEMTSKSSTNKDNGLARDAKIEYILENADSTAEEDKSGFGGDRFKFNPTLGYMLPTGTIQDTVASNEMDLSKEGDNSNEIFFNADGEETDDPTAEAEAILNELSEKELDVAYVFVKEKKQNPGLAVGEIIQKFKMNNGSMEIVKTVIMPRINDIKALKKTPNWKEKMEQRKRRRMENKRRWNVSAPQPNENFVPRPNGNSKKKSKSQPVTSSKKSHKNDFSDMVTNRGDFGMWGGHRNDGQKYPMS